jgi:predicted dehydrogenase
MKSNIPTDQGYIWRVPDEIRELRVGILGAGKMARFHLETLRSMPGVRLAAICNRSSAAGEQLAREFRIDQVYKDSYRMLVDESLDAVFIAVSHAANFEVASSVLQSGIPCLVEKPAGYCLDETVHLSRLACASQCLNLVALNRRFYSVINQALLAVLHFGPVKGVLVEAHEPILEYRSRRSFASSLYDDWLVANTIHAIDLLRMIGGEVAGVQGFKKCINERRGDSFSAAIEFENGALGTFISHWNSAGGVGLKIYGDGIVAELISLDEGFVRYDNGRRIKLQPDWTDIQFKPGLYMQNAAFLQSVCDRQLASFPASDLNDNVKTMRLIAEIAGNSLTQPLPQKSEDKSSIGQLVLTSA